MSSASSAYLHEKIAKASALPESFYPEFLQYSKESFEQNNCKQTSSSSNNKKREREQEVKEESEKRTCRKQKTE